MSRLCIQRNDDSGVCVFQCHTRIPLDGAAAHIHVVERARRRRDSPARPGRAATSHRTPRPPGETGPGGGGMSFRFAVRPAGK
jgi:hypothetical protein